MGIMERKNLGGWVTVGLLALLSCIGMGLIYFSASLYIGPVCDTFGIGRTQFGFITSTATVSGFLVSFFLGRMLRVLRKMKYVLMIGVTAGIGYLLLFYFSPSVYGLYFAGVLRGIFTSSSSVGCMSILVSKWFTENRALAVSITTAGSGLGGIIITPLVSYMIATFGWRTCGLYSAIILACVAVPVFLLLREEPKERALPEESGDGTAKPLPKELSGMEVSQALKTPIFWMGVLAAIMFAIFVSTYITNLADILAKTPIAPAIIPAIISTVYLVNVITKIIIGAVLDRFGIVRTTGICVTCYLAASICMLNARSAPFGFAFALLFGASYNLIATPLTVLVEQLFGRKNYSTFIGYYIAFMEIGFATSPIICGLSVDYTGSYAVAICIAMALSVLAFVLVFSAVRLSKKYLPESNAKAADPVEAHQ